MGMYLYAQPLSSWLCGALSAHFYWKPVLLLWSEIVVSSQQGGLQWLPAEYRGACMRPGLNSSTSAFISCPTQWSASAKHLAMYQQNDGSRLRGQRYVLMTSHHYK